MSPRKVHDGCEPRRRCDRFNQFAFDVGERFTELLPVPGGTPWAGGLPSGGVMVGEVDVVSLLNRQGRISHSCERVNGRLPAFGDFSRHGRSPLWARNGQSTSVYTYRDSGSEVDLNEQGLGTTTQTPGTNALLALAPIPRPVCGESPGGSRPGPNSRWNATEHGRLRRRQRRPFTSSPDGVCVHSDGCVSGGLRSRGWGVETTLQYIGPDGSTRASRARPWCGRAPWKSAPWRVGWVPQGGHRSTGARGPVWGLGEVARSLVPAPTRSGGARSRLEGVAGTRDLLSPSP